MARLSREVLKDRINEAVFDSLDEMETDLSALSLDDQARILTDAVFNVLSESDQDELNPFVDLTEEGGEE